MNPVWWSQPYPPEGSMASTAIRRNLGVTDLHPLVILLRETAQNSWDARRDETIGLTYAIELLGEIRAASFGRHLSPGPRDGLPLMSWLRSDSPLLIVSDRRTSGLGGPTRSDVAYEGEARPDFVNFVRNVGEKRHRELGGGTYGFGKGILYRQAQAGVILVDTMCVFEGRRQRRLMAAGLGDPYTLEDRRHTGRHWWGQTVDGVIEPFIDEDAEIIAAELGLKGFSKDDTGTDVYVIGADFGPSDDPDRELDRHQAGELLVSAALWNLWPLLIDRDGRRKLDLTVTVDGLHLDIPQPDEVARLQPFVHALNQIDNGGGTASTRKSPPNEVGRFAAVTAPYVPSEPGVVRRAEPYEGPSRHCALMRSVELVVGYVEGPPPSDPLMQYGAVFRASEEADEYFAEAEPPTHNAWYTQNLSGTARGVVTGARRFYSQQMERLVSEPSRDGERVAVPLGKLSHHLARLLPAAAGDGGGDDDGSGGGGGGGSARLIKLEGPPRFTLLDDEPRIVQKVTILGSKRLKVSATAVVAVDGGSERQAPDKSDLPEVLGWTAGPDTWVTGGALVVEPEDSREWTAVVRPAADASTVVRVRAEEGS